MVNIFTENFFLAGKSKNFLKGIFGVEARGPKGVFRSLADGLKILGVPFVVNQPINSPVSAACILSDARVLKWAIRQKEKGMVKKLVVGPNVVVTPNDYDNLIQHSAIDLIVEPSEWVKDLYIQLAPALSHKLVVWAAGVKMPSTIGEKTCDFVVLNKMPNRGLLNKILQHLENNRLSFKLLEYGTFDQKRYFSLLGKSKYLIYLSNSESQGLALAEAWAHNVPSFVFESGEYDSHGARVKGKVSAPYLNTETGMSFKDYSEFLVGLEEFMKKNFSPRKYAEENLTDAICAQKYLNLINA
jgi:glycosyltransferase involved in cell wall biosynthesis